MLDDLGTESATPWAREKLFQLLNYRYSAVLPTIITTSATPADIDPWLLTRMADVSRCQVISLSVPGYRGSSSQKESAARSRSGEQGKGISAQRHGPSLAFLHLVHSAFSLSILQSRNKPPCLVVNFCVCYTGSQRLGTPVLRRYAAQK